MVRSINIHEPKHGLGVTGFMLLLQAISQDTNGLQDGPHCPLCIEVLDSHEQGWYPCQCGYQVCAFCYQRLQLENNHQCPGCRTIYGAAPQEIAGKDAQSPAVIVQDPSEFPSGVISAEQEALNLERVDLEKSSGTSESQDSHTRGQVVDGKPEVDSARPAWGQNSFVEQDNGPASTSESRPEDEGRHTDPVVLYPWRGARPNLQNGAENPRFIRPVANGAPQRNNFEETSDGRTMGSSALHEDRRGLDADLYAEEAVAEDASEAPESEQDDLWEKLLSAPRPVENAKASSLRQTISQAVSHGGLSPAEGASKLVACLQDMALNGSAASPTQAIPMRPQLTQSQPSSDFTLSPSSLPRPPPPPESLLRRPEAWEGNPETHSTAAFGARQSDVEVPAPKKKTAVSGDEKLKSWMNAGLKVAAPTRSHYYAGEDGFVHATNPTIPGPSRESRFSAHGAIGDSIAQPSVAFQQKQQSNLGAAASNGGENLWGPLSKQSSSSSFWGGHQVEADPVPESVQELWADKGRMDSRFDFKPASQEPGRDSLASSLGREGSHASSFGPPVNGLLSHNSLSNYSHQAPQLFTQDQALNGHAYGGNNYPGQQARMTLGANTASSLGMAGLTSTPAQNFPTHNYLQGNRSGTPVNNQSVSPSYARGFGQAGLAAGQGYSQAFPSPLSTKGLAPPGLGGRVGGGLGNAIGPSGLTQLGASGLGNHLPRPTGLNPHARGTGVFNLPVSQPVAPRFSAQLGQGIGGYQRQPNGVSGYGGDGRNPLAGPAGQAMAPSSAAQNFGGGLDFGALKQRQMLQDLQAQQRLLQQQQQQPKAIPFGQQQVNQASQAQILLDRREQLRQLMQQGLLDLTPQQLQQLQAQQLLLNQQQKGGQQQSLWPNRSGSPGLPQPGLLNSNAGPRLFQRQLFEGTLER